MPECWLGAIIRHRSHSPLELQHHKAHTYSRLRGSRSRRLAISNFGLRISKIKSNGRGLSRMEGKVISDESGGYRILTHGHRELFPQ
jgi:hypothetical protein